jgi:hypothetical protein
MTTLLTIAARIASPMLAAFAIAYIADGFLASRERRRLRNSP